jgi:hypothetical protein
MSVTLQAPDVLEMAGAKVRVLSSCHSLWLFDPARMRFRRLPRGAHLGVPATDSDWTDYHSFELDLAAGMFVIGLNPEGTRLLRAWVHDEPCRHCGDATSEFSIAALRGTAP